MTHFFQELDKRKLEGTGELEDYVEGIGHLRLGLISDGWDWDGDVVEVGWDGQNMGRVWLWLG